MSEWKTRKVWVTRVKPGDLIRIAGLQFEVQYSEPHSDSVWNLEVSRVNQGGLLPRWATQRLHLDVDERVTVYRKEEE